mmetsp:Transcript_39104/g.102518  ORF Transcript_39104/g.102518 Transcript_39104/m.102518 type:complete len:438 (+) Transcript_39104:332-1645(+)
MQTRMKTGKANTLPASTMFTMTLATFSLKWCSDRLARLYSPTVPSSSSTTYGRGWDPGAASTLKICMFDERFPDPFLMTCPLYTIGYLFKKLTIKLNTYAPMYRYPMSSPRARMRTVYCKLDPKWAIAQATRNPSTRGTVSRPMTAPIIFPRALSFSSSSMNGRPLAPTPLGPDSIIMACMPFWGNPAPTGEYIAMAPWSGIGCEIDGGHLRLERCRRDAKITQTRLEADLSQARHRARELEEEMLRTIALAERWEEVNQPVLIAISDFGKVLEVAGSDPDPAAPERFRQLIRLAKSCPSLQQRVANTIDIYKQALVSCDRRHRADMIAHEAEKRDIEAKISEERAKGDERVKRAREKMNEDIRVVQSHLGDVESERDQLVKELRDVIQKLEKTKKAMQEQQTANCDYFAMVANTAAEREAELVLLRNEFSRSRKHK